MQSGAFVLAWATRPQPELSPPEGSVREECGTRLGRPCVCSPAFPASPNLSFSSCSNWFLLSTFTPLHKHNLEVYRSGIEPGLPAWQASILTPRFTIVQDSNLDHWTTIDLFIKSSKALTPTWAQIFHRLQNLG